MLRSVQFGTPTLELERFVCITSFRPVNDRIERKRERERWRSFVGIYFGLRIGGSRMMLTIFVSGSVSVCICMCTLCRLLPVNAQLCVCFVQKNWIYAVRGDRKEKVLWTGTEKNQLEFVCCKGKGRAGVHFHYIFTSCRLRNSISNEFMYMCNVYPNCIRNVFEMSSEFPLDSLHLNSYPPFTVRIISTHVASL